MILGKVYTLPDEKSVSVRVVNKYYKTIFINKFKIIHSRKIVENLRWNYFEYWIVPIHSEILPFRMVDKFGLSFHMTEQDNNEV
jgi:hypothetical protein